MCGYKLRKEKNLLDGFTIKIQKYKYLVHWHFKQSEAALTYAFLKKKNICSLWFEEQLS